MQWKLKAMMTYASMECDGSTYVLIAIVFPYMAMFFPAVQ